MYVRVQLLDHSSMLAAACIHEMIVYTAARFCTITEVTLFIIVRCFCKPLRVNVKNGHSTAKLGYKLQF